MPAPPSHDKYGQQWAKLSELKAGSMIKLDRGFDCHNPGIVEVKAWKDGRLYFACEKGQHFLFCQADDGDHLVGIYKVEKS